MTKNNKAVIFDLDGVLVDTAVFHKQSWMDLAAKEGFVMTEEFFYQTFGMQNYQILPTLLKRELSRDEVEKFSDWKESRYRELIKGKIQPLEGVFELVKGLKEAGFRLAVGTSAPKANLELMLSELPIGKFFDAYTTAEDVSRGKPFPDTFLKAAEKINMPPMFCVVVEDSIAGVKAGKAAGMKVVAVTNTTKRDELSMADVIVDSLAELDADSFGRMID
jgi:beta-phosphoglucomutase